VIFLSSSEETEREVYYRFYVTACGHIELRHFGTTLSQIVPARVKRQTKHPADRKPFRNVGELLPDCTEKSQNTVLLMIADVKS
jgi:hypothetical protein